MREKVFYKSGRKMFYQENGEKYGFIILEGEVNVGDGYKVIGTESHLYGMGNGEKHFTIIEKKKLKDNFTWVKIKECNHE